MSILSIPRTASRQALAALYFAHRHIGSQVPGQDTFEGRMGRPTERFRPPVLTMGLARENARVFEPMRYRAHPDGPRAPWLMRQVGHLAQSMADALLVPFIAVAVGYSLCAGGVVGARRVLEHQALGVCLTRGMLFGGALGVLCLG